MKVLNLQCEQGHGFEGWFGSEADHADQRARGLLECPLCGSKSVQRLPSAPRLNLSGATAPAPAPGVPASAAAPTPERASVEALWLQAMRHVIATTEDVGERFPEEARRIHYGETPERAIRGQASPDQAQSLRDEGIEVFSMAVPAAAKGPLQ